MTSKARSSMQLGPFGAGGGHLAVESHAIEAFGHDLGVGLVVVDDQHLDRRPAGVLLERRFRFFDSHGSMIQHRRRQVNGLASRMPLNTSTKRPCVIAGQIVAGELLAGRTQPGGIIHGSR